MPFQNVAATTFVDKNVPAGNHHYELRAFDAAGNGSTVKSVDVVFGRPAPIDRGIGAAGREVDRQEDF